jgi:hypothetical protein
VSVTAGPSAPSGSAGPGSAGPGSPGIGSEVPGAANRGTGPAPTGDACPLCGAPLDPDQEWCIRCGAAARTRLAASSSWKTPIIAFAVVAVLALGVLAASLVKLAGGSGPAPPPVTRTMIAAPSAAVPTTPPATPPASTPSAPLPGAGATGTSTPGAGTTGAGARGTGATGSRTTTPSRGATSTPPVAKSPARSKPLTATQRADLRKLESLERTRKSPSEKQALREAEEHVRSGK